MAVMILVIVYRTTRVSLSVLFIITMRLVLSLEHTPTGTWWLWNVCSGTICEWVRFHFAELVHLFCLIVTVNLSLFVDREWGFLPFASFIVTQKSIRV